MANFRDFDDEYDYDGLDDKHEEMSIREKYAHKEAESHSKTRRSTKGRVRLRPWVKALLIGFEIIVVGILVVILLVVNKISQIEIQPINEDVVITRNEDINEDTVEVLKGYRNILLVGIDARDNRAAMLTKKEENHADTMIVASINQDTGDIKLVSLYRDTLLEIPKCDGQDGYEYNKATESYFYYGPESTISMFNRNFDLDIEDYVIVNWKALIDIVNAVGGIDIEINDIELYWLNAYLVDTSVNTGVSYTEVPTSGYVHLDGIQATAYCRIRYGGGSDYRRTERQRDVIQLVINKAKSMSPTALYDAANAIIKNVATSLELSELYEISQHITSYNFADSSGFPFEFEPISHPVYNDSLVPANLESNVTALHKFLFGTENYVPSNTVSSISDYIITITGVDQKQE